MAERIIDADVWNLPEHISFERIGEWVGGSALAGFIVGVGSQYLENKGIIPPKVHSVGIGIGAGLGTLFDSGVIMLALGGITESTPGTQ